MDDNSLPEMSLVIDAVDHTGTRVTCDAGRWNRKVIVNHPEIGNRIDDIVATIRDPDIVLADRAHASRRHLMTTHPNGLFLVAVIEYGYHEREPSGWLVTAFVRRRLRTGDVVLYTRGRG